MAHKPPPINLTRETVDRNASGPAPEQRHHSLPFKNSNPRPTPPPRRTDHTYHDWARYPPDDHAVRTAKKASNNFPAKLHRILSNPEHAHAISWQRHGRAWKIKDKKLLVEKVIPKYFTQSKFESFTRQLSGWGFKRLHQSGLDFHCYYHECFLRGLPHLTRMMKRSEPNLGKLLPFVDSEPNFYNIDLKYPLPTSIVRRPLACTSGVRPPYPTAHPVPPLEAYKYDLPMATPAHRHCDRAQGARLYPSYYFSPPHYGDHLSQQYPYPYHAPYPHQSYLHPPPHPHSPGPYPVVKSTQASGQGIQHHSHLEHSSPHFRMPGPALGLNENPAEYPQDRKQYAEVSLEQHSQNPHEYLVQYCEEFQQYPKNDDVYPHQLNNYSQIFHTESPLVYND